jgi:hypothetical protein
MPLQGGLGRAHPGRAPPGKDDAGRCGHDSDGSDRGPRAAIVGPKGVKSFLGALRAR